MVTQLEGQYDSPWILLISNVSPSQIRIATPAELALLAQVTHVVTFRTFLTIKIKIKHSSRLEEYERTSKHPFLKDFLFVLCLLFASI